MLTCMQMTKKEKRLPPYHAAIKRARLGAEIHLVL